MTNDWTHLFLKFSLQSAAAMSGAIAPFFVDGKVKRIRNVSYGKLSEQILDVYYAPRAATTLRPISILIHGGGFSFFSKNSHATAAGELAMNGSVVFSIDYRLAPKHPFPSGLSDTILAYSWIMENATRYGGDVNRISLVGESAGANFALSLCLHLFGIKSLDSTISLPSIPEHKPKHVVLHCGHLHVSNVDRYLQKKEAHALVKKRVAMIQRDYLPNFQALPDGAGLADPLVEIEKLAEQKKTLPAGFPQIFIPVGDRDPVAGDSYRLAEAMKTLGQEDRLRVYAGETHAFYIMPFRKNTRRCWDDIFQFLKT